MAIPRSVYHEDAVFAGAGEQSRNGSTPAGGSADSLAGAALLAGRGEDTVARAIREEVAERRAAMLSMAGTPR